MSTHNDSPAAPGHPYDALTPEVILAAVERYDLHCTGTLLALNSYENRVYRVGTEERGPVAAKFYRPGRWSDAAIAEEHAFAAELVELEIPAVAPLAAHGHTLNEHAGFRYALYPWQPGRSPELESPDDRRVLGRYLGRLHRAGEATAFRHRPTLTVADFGRRALADLVASPFVPGHVHEAFASVAGQLLTQVEGVYAEVGRVPLLRLHGDCHLGNILWSEHGPHLVDFDDCMMGPAVQDLWMLLSGERADMEAQLADLLAGYTEFADFDARELRLIEALRSLRLLHYNAWIARRWDDPAFPRNFPWFDGARHWEALVLALREQQALLGEPPLAWRPGG